MAPRDDKHHKMTGIAQTKTCSRCGVEKPLRDFHRRSSSPDGHSGVCKTCRAEQQAARYYSNPSVKEDMRRRSAEERRELAWYRKHYPRPDKPWNGE